MGEKILKGIVYSVVFPHYFVIGFINGFKSAIKKED